MSIWKSLSASLISRKLPSLHTPALLTSISISPICCVPSATAAATWAASRTSAWTAAQGYPWDFSSSASVLASGDTSKRISLAPCFAKIFTIPSPIPREAPVISAVLPVSFPIFLFSLPENAAQAAFSFIFIHLYLSASVTISFYRSSACRGYIIPPQTHHSIAGPIIPPQTHHSATAPSLYRRHINIMPQRNGLLNNLHSRAKSDAESARASFIHL